MLELRASSLSGEISKAASWLMKMGFPRVQGGTGEGALHKRCFPGGFSCSFFPCCLWSTITLQTAVSKGVIWSWGISAVSVPLLEAPHKPLLRMPDPSNSKSNNWSELRNRLACWHFNGKQLQHSLFALRLPAPSVWSSKGSNPEKKQPSLSSSCLRELSALCVVSLPLKAQRSLFNVS